MKKGIEWFKLLSEKEQQEFKENCEDFERVMNENHYNFEEFIWCCGFIWYETPQGSDYWNNISNRYL